MQSGYSPFVVNIVPLQNVITNASGLDPTTILSNSVADLQTVVNTSNRTIYTDFISAYTTGGVITVQSPLVLSNGTLVTGATGGGSVSSIEGSGTFINAGTTVDLGVGTTTIFQIGAIGDVLVQGGSEMRVSSMTFTADYITASTINVGGTCFAQNFVTLSDSGVKSQISTLTDVRGFDRIGTYRFKYTGGVEDEIGLLAQEVEDVYPECVVENAGVKYIKYNAVVALLLGAVRRLEERVGVLEGFTRHQQH